jgi:hypothetical protein
MIRIRGTHIRIFEIQRRTGSSPPWDTHSSLLKKLESVSDQKVKREWAYSAREEVSRHLFSTFRDNSW